jgi:hypothetical protein
VVAFFWFGYDPVANGFSDLLVDTMVHRWTTFPWISFWAPVRTTFLLDGQALRFVTCADDVWAFCGHEFSDDIRK